MLVPFQVVLRGPLKAADAFEGINRQFASPEGVRAGVSAAGSSIRYPHNLFSRSPVAARLAFAGLNEAAGVHQLTCLRVGWSFATRSSAVIQEACCWSGRDRRPCLCTCLGVCS